MCKFFFFPNIEKSPSFLLYLTPYCNPFTYGLGLANWQAQQIKQEGIIFLHREKRKKKIANCQTRCTTLHFQKCYIFVSHSIRKCYAELHKIQVLNFFQKVSKFFLKSQEIFFTQFLVQISENFLHAKLFVKHTVGNSNFQRSFLEAVERRIIIQSLSFLYNLCRFFTIFVISWDYFTLILGRC